jgi:tetratricopeptide (TPR) repeat protein
LYLSWAKGDFFRAETHGRIAIELDPHNSICYSVYASILSTAGKFEESIDACNTALKLDKTSFLAYLFKGWSLLHLRRYSEAVTIFEHLMDISRRHQFSQNALIMAYCVIWRFDKARSLLNDLDERSKEEYIACTIRGLSAAYMDDFDKAFYYFDEAYKARDGMLLSLKHEHWVPPALKTDPRFKTLLDKIGFPEDE